MLVVTKAFDQQVGPVFLSFPAGKVIEDEVLEEALLTSAAPVVKVGAEADLIQCPHCKRKFTIRQAVDGED